MTIRPVAKFFSLSATVALTSAIALAGTTGPSRADGVNASSSSVASVISNGTTMAGVRAHSFGSNNAVAGVASIQISSNSIVSSQTTASINGQTGGNNAMTDEVLRNLQSSQTNINSGGNAVQQGSVAVSITNIDNR